MRTTGGDWDIWPSTSEASSPTSPRKPEIPPELVYKYWHAATSSGGILPRQIADAPALEHDTEWMGKPAAQPGFGPAMTKATAKPILQNSLKHRLSYVPLSK